MTKVKAKFVVFLTMALMTSILSVAAARADETAPDSPFSGHAHDSGADVVGALGEDATKNIPFYPTGAPGAAIPVGYSKPVYHFGYTGTCNNATPDSPAAEALCNSDVTNCQYSKPPGPGPLTRLWHRAYQDGQPVGPWQPIGTTCWPNLAPGGIPPRITMGMIQNAFHHTPWAAPRISTQPTGNITLVGLPTFYLVTWDTSAGGFKPGQVDTTTILGRTVYIRPSKDLSQLTYVFGDGQEFGPTTELGGTYPSGSITHTFTTKGSFPSHISTVFQADFSLDGATWAAIPGDSGAVAGPATTVTVKTATARLVAH